MIVHINPLYREELPTTATEIMNRINEISFNASLLRELRSIDFVNRLIDRGMFADGAMKRNIVHSVSDDALMSQLGIATKMTHRTLLLQLRDAGRAAMERFLSEQRTNSASARPWTCAPCSARTARRSEAPEPPRRPLHYTTRGHAGACTRMSAPGAPVDIEKASYFDVADMRHEMWRTVSLYFHLFDKYILSLFSPF